MKRKTKKMIELALITLALGAIGAWLIESGNIRGNSTKNVGIPIPGEALFAANCASCHGIQAVGENPSKLSGGEKEEGGYWAPALNGTAHAWHHPPAVLFQTIKKGSMAQDSPMRAFEGRLSDDQIRSIIGYLQSLWPEEIRERYIRFNG